MILFLGEKELNILNDIREKILFHSQLKYILL